MISAIPRDTEALDSRPPSRGLRPPSNPCTGRSGRARYPQCYYLHTPALPYLPSCIQDPEQLSGMRSFSTFSSHRGVALPALRYVGFLCGEAQRRATATRSHAPQAEQHSTRGNRHESYTRHHTTAGPGTPLRRTAPDHPACPHMAHLSHHHRWRRRSGMVGTPLSRAASASSPSARQEVHRLARARYARTLGPAGARRRGGEEVPGFATIRR